MRIDIESHDKDIMKGMTLEFPLEDCSYAFNDNGKLEDLNFNIGELSSRESPYVRVELNESEQDYLRSLLNEICTESWKQKHKGKSLPMEESVSFDVGTKESAIRVQMGATVACPNCGTIVFADASYCQECGHDMLEGSE